MLNFISESPKQPRQNDSQKLCLYFSNYYPPPNKSISKSKGHQKQMEFFGFFPPQILLPQIVSKDHNALSSYSSSHLLSQSVNMHILGIRYLIAGKIVMASIELMVWFQHNICYIKCVAHILTKLKSRVPLKILSTLMSKIRMKTLHQQLT